jgi:hypothetical protein
MTWRGCLLAWLGIGYYFFYQHRASAVSSYTREKTKDWSIDWGQIFVPDFLEILEKRERT